MIKLPFNKDLMEEMLVPPKYLEQQMKQSGFECIYRYDLGNNEDTVPNGNREQNKILNPEQLKHLHTQFNGLNYNDQFHVSLYSLYVFKHYETSTQPNAK